MAYFLKLCYYPYYPMLYYCSNFSESLILPIIQDPFPHTQHSLTFKPCLLQTTRKEFAEHWLKDTYCAANKEGGNAIKILT